MHKNQAKFLDDVNRLVALDSRDIEDLRRLVSKLTPIADVLASGRPRQARADSDCEPLIRRARMMLEDRRKRLAIFGRQMFSEPAWEMLLILYLSDGGQRLTQASLGEQSGASRSTAMRWIDYLAGRGLISLEDHPTDKRRNFIALSEKGRTLISLYLSETA